LRDVVRVSVVLGGMMVLALALVHLRVEKTRSAARALEMERQCLVLRRELWQVQTSLAGLRAPKRIHERVEVLQAGVIPPNAAEPQQAVTTRRPAGAIDD